MIGDRIRKKRKEKGLTQQALASLIGTSSGFICEVEQGKKVPGGTILLSLKRELGVSIDWLLDEDQNTDQAPALPPQSPVVEKINIMLENMSVEAQREVLKYAEERKLLAKQKKSRKVA